MDIPSVLYLLSRYARYKRSRRRLGTPWPVDSRDVALCRQADRHMAATHRSQRYLQACVLTILFFAMHPQMRYKDAYHDVVHCKVGLL